MADLFPFRELPAIGRSVVGGFLFGSPEAGSGVGTASHFNQDGCRNLCQHRQDEMAVCGQATRRSRSGRSPPTALDAAIPAEPKPKARPLAWFRIRPFWVTQGVLKRPAFEGQISVGSVSCAGGGEPPRVKLAGAEARPGRAGSASADGRGRSAARTGSCPGARHDGCAGSSGG
jgi:hypothetical protein